MLTTTVLLLCLASSSTAAASSYKGRSCTQEEARESATYEHLWDAGVTVRAEPHQILQSVRRALPNASLIVDVGANKLYWTSQIIARWMPELQFSPRVLAQMYATKAQCGTFNDGREIPDPAHCFVNANPCKQGRWRSAMPPSLRIGRHP